jgi:hypothetical protein
MNYFLLYLVFIGFNVILDRKAHPNRFMEINFDKISKSHLLTGRGLRFHERLFMIVMGPIGAPFLLLSSYMVDTKQARLRELFKHRELTHMAAIELYELVYIVPLTYGRSKV